MNTTTQRYADAKQTLDAAGQLHVLSFYDELDDAQRDRLLAQVEGVDWPEIARLIKSHALDAPPLHLPDDIRPAPCYPRQPTPELKDKYHEARALGEKLIRGGMVAAFTVAGGQGTRLGWDAPKGTFPATPIRKLSLFGCFAEYIQSVQQRHNVIKIGRAHV